MDNLLELMKGRRTYRRFEQKPIAQEVIDEILTAARYASSATNRQPLNYVVVKDADKVAAVFEQTRWAGALPPEIGHPKEHERPVLFIGVIQNTDMNPNSDTDAGLAISNMTLAAWNHGIGSCIIGACDKVTLGQMFGLKDTQKVHTVIAFGYPSHTSTIVDLEADGDHKYYVDDKRDYYVPKRQLSDVVTYY